MKNLKPLLASALLALLCGAAQAVPFTIHNTGVDASGTPLGEDAPELHYVLIAPGPTPGTPFVTTAAGGYPVGPWLGDGGSSAWIAPSSNTEGETTTYFYRTTFDLTGFDPSTAVIAGRWAVDNTGLEIYVNGLGTGNYAGGFSSWSSFSVTTGFNDGLNTLDFAVYNGGGPTGLRVEFLTATADRIVVPAVAGVPEPASLALVALAVAGLGRRQRKGS